MSNLYTNKTLSESLEVIIKLFNIRQIRVFRILKKNILSRIYRVKKLIISIFKYLSLSPRRG